MAELPAHLTDHVLPHLPIRQWVLSVPRRFRPFLRHNPDIAGAALRIFLRAIRTMLRQTSPGAPSGGFSIDAGPRAMHASRGVGRLHAYRG